MILIMRKRLKGIERFWKEGCPSEGALEDLGTEAYRI